MSVVTRPGSLADPQDPWERRPGERTFEAFAYYRDLGPDRSLRRVGRDLGKARATIEELSVRWDWVARAMAYDGHLDQERRASHERALREMSERQAQIGHAMQLLAARKLEQLAKALDADPNAVSSSEAIAMIRAGSQLEREARGTNAAPDDANERIGAFERIVIEAIDQTDPETAYRVRQALYRLEHARSVD